MESLVLKCWNGIYGSSSFEIIGWQCNFNDILEAGAWYKDIWNYCWIEDASGKVLYTIPNAEKRQEMSKSIIFNKLYEIMKGGEL